MRTLFRIQIVALALAAFAVTGVTAQQVSTVRLVVMMSIDQLGQTMLERYEPALTGGLKRLLDDGRRYTQASHAHARTSTAPGHATLATGVFPSRHGVVANSWAQRVGFEWVSGWYAVRDTDTRIVGFENEAVLEGRSPRTMLRSGITDWAYGADEDARIVSISKKDRAAVPFGGKSSEHVYWMVPEVAMFVTSTHYRDDYPGWLEDFNEEVMPTIAAVQEWRSEVPEEWRGLARPDSAVYEGDGVHTTFPHVSSEENVEEHPQIHNLWAFDQPRADDAVLGLAREAIEELDLGGRNNQDFLAISLSAVDRVGHGYGPTSQEVLSTVIHLDRILGEFFEYLDDEVGEGRWLIGVSSDHGVMVAPEAQVESGVNPEARRITTDEMNQHLSAALRVGGGGTPDDVAARIAGVLNDSDMVARAYTHHELTRGMPADSFAVLFRNSYYPGRAWGPLARFGVDLRFHESDLVSYRTGTNHESTYWHDRHVPMIFMGAGIVPGVSETPVYTVDFAPTLAGLAGIPTPDDLDGRRLF